MRSTAGWSPSVRVWVELSFLIGLIFSGAQAADPNPNPGGTISINFYDGSTGDTGTQLTADVSAGKIVRTNWNNLLWSPPSHYGQAVNDDAGVAVPGVAVCTSDSFTQIFSLSYTLSANSTGNDRLMKNCLFTDQVNDVYVRVSGLPATFTSSGYNVYVYTDALWDYAATNVEFGTSTLAQDNDPGLFTLVTSQTVNENGADWTPGTSTFVEGLNYVVFPVRVESDFTLHIRATHDRAGINGIQIVSLAATTGGTASTTAITSVAPASAQPFGTQVTFTATVTAGSGTDSPAGSVEFRDGDVTGTLLGTGTLSGTGGTATASYQTAANQLAVGVHSIVAVYAGGGSFTGSSSAPASYTITASTGTATTTAITSVAPASAQPYGTQVTFIATVTAGSGTDSPAGPVDFRDGGAAGTLLGTGTLSGTGGTATASYQTAANQLAVGTHSIVAIYVGDDSFAGSTSASVPYLITAQPLTITASAQSKTYGDTATLGSAAFTVGAGLLGSEEVTAVSLTSPGAPATAAVGGYNIVAANATGQNGFLASNYNLSYVAGTLTVNAAALSITANDDSKTFGDTKAYGPGSTAFTSNGLQNGETIGSVTITAGGGEAADAPIGTYPLTPSDAIGGTFAAGNYTITYHAGTLTVRKTVPTLMISAPSATVTLAGPVTYTITYAGVTTVKLANADVSLNTTGTAAANIAVSGSGTTERTVTLSGITGNGTLGISLAAGTAANSVGDLVPATGPSAVFTVNTPPLLSGTPVVTPASPLLNRRFTVSVQVSDADNDAMTLTFAWGEGPNTVVLVTGATMVVSHTYATAGQKTVTISLNDGVNPAVVAPPLNITVIATTPLLAKPAAKVSGAYTSAKTKTTLTDAIAMSGTLPPLADGFVFAGQTVHILMGGAEINVPVPGLSAKGVYAAPKGDPTYVGSVSFKPKLKAVKGTKPVRYAYVAGTAVPFSIKIKGNFLAAWQVGLPFDPSHSMGSTLIIVPCEIDLGGTVYAFSPRLARIVKVSSNGVQTGSLK